MPPLPFADQVLKFEFITNLQIGQAVNIFHAKYTGGPPANADLETFYTANSAVLLRPYIHNLAVDYELASIKITDLTSDTSAAIEVSPAVAGTNGGSGIPQSASVLMSYIVARRYRGGHARSYLPFGTDADLANNVTWSGTFTTNVSNDMTAFVNAINAYSGSGLTSLTFGQLSYVSAGARRATPVFDPALIGAVRPRICTQRRRLGQIGG